MNHEIKTCRVCKDYIQREGGVQYGVRHYVHAECGMKKWGAEFFDKLHGWQLRNLPYLPIVDAGLTVEYKAALKKAGGE